MDVFIFMIIVVSASGIVLSIQDATKRIDRRLERIERLHQDQLEQLHIMNDRARFDPQFASLGEAGSTIHQSRE